MDLKFFCFEPFGVGSLLNRNIGAEVMEKIIEDIGYVDNIKLPVSELCKEIVSSFCIKSVLSNSLIIIFGEHLSSKKGIRVEPYANTYKGKLYSPFATKVLEKYPSLLDPSQDIGEYYCNDVYKIFLENKANCLFIHCGLGYKKDYKVLLDLISNIKKWSEKENLRKRY